MSGILSTDTALANNPYVKNVEDEKKLLKEDEQFEANQIEAGSFNL